MDRLLSHLWVVAGLAMTAVLIYVSTGNDLGDVRRRAGSWFEGRHYGCRIHEEQACAAAFEDGWKKGYQRAREFDEIGVRPGDRE